MSWTMNATVSLDARLFDRGITDCVATVSFGFLDEINELSITLDNLSVTELNTILDNGFNIIDCLTGSPVHGHLENRLTFKTTIACVRGMDFGNTSIVIHCLAGPAHVLSEQTDPRHDVWKFRLSNFRIAFGDVFTHQPPPFNTVPPERMQEYQELISECHHSFSQPILDAQQIPWILANRTIKGRLIRNRVIFTFQDRLWYLDHDLHGCCGTNQERITTPIVSGTLSTPYSPDDNQETLQIIANGVCDLLGFALARDVKWISCGCFNKQGKSPSTFHRAPSVLPFNHHGSLTIDNWEIGNLKNLLEVGLPILQTDRDWWSQSFGLLVQARGSLALEVKCSLLNTLLDRFADKIIARTNTAEIDAHLSKRIDESQFKTNLHSLLESLSVNWGRHRTDALIATIKQWNRQPSFPQKISRACAALDIQPMPLKRLGFRHVLIHQGEMHGELDSAMERIRYYDELEALVLLLICRTLRFNGLINVHIFGNQPGPVSSFLTNNKPTRSTDVKD